MKKMLLAMLMLGVHTFSFGEDIPKLLQEFLSRDMHALDAWCRSTEDLRFVAWTSWIKSPSRDRVKRMHEDRETLKALYSSIDVILQDEIKKQNIAGLPWEVHDVRVQRAISLQKALQLLEKRICKLEKVLWAKEIKIIRSYIRSIPKRLGKLEASFSV